MAEPVKILELTSNPWPARWGVLKKVLKEKGCDVVFEIKEVKNEGLKESLNEIIHSDFTLCRVADEFVPLVVALLPQTTMDVSLSNSAGLLVKEGGRFWPKSFVDEAFTKSVSAHIGQVDLNASALVIGSGGVSRLVIAALVRLGFSQINISDNDPKHGHAAVAELKGRFFDTHFKYIPTQDLTTLPGIHSLAINCNPLRVDDDLYAELYFFNFLKTGGVVVDLTLVPSRSPLIIEAEKWGARYVEGDALAADRDVLMVQKYLQITLDVQSYRAELRKEIDAVPFDPSPYLKRFSDRAL